ncbi:MAG: DNA recombination protein RmuC [Vampirovibrio sp.]|nr:DNA recombination protein RmuC [Vampirovibrio sp.]
MSFVFGIVGIIIGLFIGWLLAGRQAEQKHRQIQTDHQHLVEQDIRKQSELAAAKTQLDALALQQTEGSLELEKTRLQAAELQAQKAAVESRLTTLQEEQVKQETLRKKEFEAFMLKQLDTLKQNFEEKAHNEHQENQERLDEKMKNLLKPLTEIIEEYQEKVEQVEKEHHTSTELIRVDLKRVVDTNTKVYSALSTNKGRGDWGELQLIRLLEESGLHEGTGYKKQTAFAEGKKRPDVQVFFPDGRSMFIDAKTIQLDLNQEDDGTEEAFEQKKQRHLTSLKSAVKDLVGKDYQTEVSHASDYIILYVPVESMLAYASLADPELLNWAYRQRVILASPLIVMAILGMVHRTWQNAQLSKEADTIRDLGKDLYKQANTLVERFQKLGRAMGTLNTAYQDTWTSLDGNQGLTKKVKKLADYGCQDGKPLPETVYRPENLMETKEPLEESRQGYQREQGKEKPVVINSSN